MLQIHNYDGDANMYAFRQVDIWSKVYIVQDFVELQNFPASRIRGSTTATRRLSPELTDFCALRLADIAAGARPWFELGVDMQIVAFGGEIIVCGRRGLPILEHSRVGRAYSDTRIPAEAFKRPFGDTRKAASQLPQIGPMATVQHSSLAAWPGPYTRPYTKPESSFGATAPFHVPYDYHI